MTSWPAVSNKLCRAARQEVPRNSQVRGGHGRWKARLIRNPTYLGLDVLHLGLWLVWPTTMVAAYAVVFFIIMEIQVRCEEEHLTSLHGEVFTSYAHRTWRYLPWVY